MDNLVCSIRFGQAEKGRAGCGKKGN
jgi:hypothetical protein